MWIWGLLATLCFIVVLVLYLVKPKIKYITKTEIKTETIVKEPDQSTLNTLKIQESYLLAKVEELDKFRSNTTAAIEAQREQFEVNRKYYDDTIKALQTTIAELEQRRNSLTDSTAGLEASVKKYQLELEALEAAVMSLQEQRSEANLRLTEQGGGRVLEHNSADAALTKVLDSLRADFPQYADLWSDIEWKKIWQPKFQAMTTDIMAPPVVGIYRIYTDIDGVVRSYIGQARNIRERWSEHIKAMVGVNKASNSKLYNSVKPYNAHFEIIERCTVDELNTKEHYWIKYYDSVRTGYNTKT